MQIEILPNGQCVHTNLCGFGAGIVVESRPHELSGHLYDVVFADGRRKNGVTHFAIKGRQWRVLDEVVCKEEVAASIGRADAYRKASDDSARLAAAVRASEILALKTAAENAHLVQLDRDASTVQVAANIRRHLKQRFPGNSFSVRCVGHASVVVGWANGPSTVSVSALLAAFKAGRYDSQAECYVFANTPWAEVFGSLLYIRCDRQHSDDLIGFALAQISVPDGEQLTVQGYRSGDYVSTPDSICLPPGVVSLQSWITSNLARSAVVGKAFNFT